MTIREARLIKIALILTLLTYLAGAGNLIQEVDPAQYAEIAREMVESHDWLVLHDNYGPYLDKPPITFWIIGSSYKIFGVNNFAYRLPTILFAILSILILGRIALILYNHETAWLAMLILSSSEAYSLMVADPKIDMFLVGFLIAAFWAYFESKTRPAMMYLFYLFCGLAVMTKGPIGLMIPAAAIGAELLLCRDWKGIRKLKPIAGLIILALAIAPWYLVLGQETGGSGPYFMLFEQSFGRILVRNFTNNFGPFYFSGTFLWTFLPWSLAVLFLIAARLRAFWKRPDKFEFQPRRILVWWFLIPFLFISAASYKLPQYLFWLLPPLAILLADFLIEISQEPQIKWLKHLVRTQVICAFAVILAMLAAATVCFPVHGIVAWMLILAGLAGFLGLMFLPAGPIKNLAILPASAMILFNLIFSLHIYSETLKYQYADQAAKIIRQQDPSGPVVYVYKLKAAKALAFYSGRKVEIVHLDQLKNMAGERKKILVLVKEPRLRAVRRFLGRGFRIHRLGRFDEYHTSVPTAKFLYYKTRPSTLQGLLLLEISTGA